MHTWYMGSEVLSSFYYSANDYSVIEYTTFVPPLCLLGMNGKFHLLDVGLKHLLVIFQEEYQTRLQAPKLAAKEQSIL